MNKIKNIFRKYPLFVLLLPAFYFVHGYVQYVELMTFGEIIPLLLFYSFTAFLLTLLFKLYYKNILRAGLATFIFLLLYFFFSELIDFLRNMLGSSFLTRYTIIVPFLFLLAISILVFLKKTKKHFTRFSIYLNLLFVILLITEVFFLSKKKSKSNPDEPILINTLNYCDTCSKPDIYFILTDEYTGSSTLKELFSFDNSDFENYLHSKGFHIINNSISNYNFTVYSMASLFNMNYIKGIDSDFLNNDDILQSRFIIRNNNLVQFLNKLGYHIENLSFFDIGRTTPLIESQYFLHPVSLIKRPLLPNKISYELGFHVASKETINKIATRNLRNCQEVDKALRETVIAESKGPKFVYAHFIMPHAPYYFDRNGNRLSFEKLEDRYKTNKSAYIEYLIYANRKFTELIDYIQENSKTPPVIILMSDHGFKQYTSPVDTINYFKTINAVYLPNRNYQQFYDGMSNVNQFRILLNSQFGQRLSLLKDSISYIRE